METDDEGRAGADAVESDSYSAPSPILLRDPPAKKDNPSAPDEMETDSGGQSPILQREPPREDQEDENGPQDDEMESEDEESDDDTPVKQWLKREMARKQSNISFLLHQLKLYSTE